MWSHVEAPPALVSGNLHTARRSRHKRLWGGTSTPLLLAGRELVPPPDPPLHTRGHLTPPVHPWRPRGEPPQAGTLPQLL